MRLLVAVPWGQASDSLPNRLAEINLRWARRGSDPRAGSGADCGTSQRRPKQRSAYGAGSATNYRAAAGAITG